MISTANEMDSHALPLQPPLNLPHAYFSWKTKRWDRLGRYQAYFRGLEAISNQLVRAANGISSAQPISISLEFK